jgi:hypothetical protein
MHGAENFIQVNRDLAGRCFLAGKRVVIGDSTLVMLNIL